MKEVKALFSPRRCTKRQDFTSSGFPKCAARAWRGHAPRRVVHRVVSKQEDPSCKRGFGEVWVRVGVETTLQCGKSYGHPFGTCMHSSLWQWSVLVHHVLRNYVGNGQVLPVSALHVALGRVCSGVLWHLPSPTRSWLANRVRGAKRGLVM